MSLSPENVLDILLRSLPLPKTVIDLVREMFWMILSEIRILSGYSKFSRTWKNTNEKNVEKRIEIASKNLKIVIDFFQTAGDDRVKFVRSYPGWEKQRIYNINNLRKIADSIQTDRTLSNITKIVGGGVGVAGGAAIIGSLLFPPAAPALLPAWLGGATVTALIPSFLLPAGAAAVTSPLVIGGGLAAGAGGVTQVAASVTELVRLNNRINEAKEICRRDGESFESMRKWFKRTQELEHALEELFGMDVLDIIFKDLKDYFKVRTCWDSPLFKLTLKSSIRRIFRHVDFVPKFDPSLQAAMTAVLFAVFLVKQQNRYLLNWVILTQRFGLGLMAGVDVGVEFGRLVAAGVMKGTAAGELIPKAVARKVAVGAVTVVGVALDVANIVLSSIDLAEGSKSEEQKKISIVADQLQEELDAIKKVYEELFTNAIVKFMEEMNLN